MSDRTLKHVLLVPPTMQRKEEFLSAVGNSRALHKGWVAPPATDEAYAELVKRNDNIRSAVFLIIATESDELAGVVNISDIVRRSFKSAYLSYYAFVPWTGRGFMRAGVTRAINHAFRKMKLHRLEANIQPENVRSIELARSLGFRMEGFSPRYLKVAGRWRDHERWALLSEEWILLGNSSASSRNWRNVTADSPTGKRTRR